MKKSWLRKYTKYLLIGITLLIAFLFLIGCLLPWISASDFALLGFVGIAMPYLLVILILAIIFWLFIKKKYALFLLILLCLGYKQINVMFAFNTNDSFKKVKANYNLRVASWNIGNMSGRPQNNSSKRHSAEEIINSLIKQNADVICLQEFEECRNGCKSLELIKKKYQYYYFPGWIIGPHRHGSGSAIFSKYPIIKNDSTRFENGENIITTDIAIESDTISFFTTHLDSYRFSKEEFIEIDNVVKEDAIPKNNLSGIISKMKNTLEVHNKQADIVKEYINKTNYPSIFCGDLNEVSNNNTYWKIRGNRQDAFLAKGFGLGKTFNSLSPVLRIDYVMPDNNFEVKQFNLVDEKMSDHKMLVVDLMLKKYQTEKTKN
jgi:endonuclease/exonuclease/phosphatase family metal-dependent hydrolase